MPKAAMNAHPTPSTADAQRDTLVDFLRGLAMLLVLLHHSGCPIGAYILAFHMPLFFVLSGYVEFAFGGGRHRTLGEYCKRRFNRLVMPYFAFEVANLLLWWLKCCLEGVAVSWMDCIISIVTCVNNDYIGLYGRLWFLPCMFVADMYVRVLLDRVAKNRLAQIVAILALFAGSYVTSAIIPFRLPFTMDTALFAAAFIMLGHAFGDAIRYLMEDSDNKWKMALAVASVLYVVYAVRYADASVLMYINRYGEYTSSICAAVLGTAALVIVGSWVYRRICGCRLVRELVLWYGTNSLACFPVHLTIKILILWYATLLSKWYLLFFVMLLGDMPVVSLINRYFPFFLGLTRETSK